MFISDTESRNKEYLAQHPFIQKRRYYVTMKDIPARQLNSDVTGTIPKGSVLLFSEADAENESMIMINCEYASARFCVVYLKKEDYYSVRTEQLESALKDCDEELSTMFREAKEADSHLHDMYNRLPPKAKVPLVFLIITIVAIISIFSGIFIWSEKIRSPGDTLILILIAIIVLLCVLACFFGFRLHSESAAYNEDIEKQIANNSIDAK
nr:hypothetical protein [Oscillospiraceae bacterium]